MIPSLRSRLHHSFTLTESSPEVRDSDGGHGALPMTCYLVCEDGEPFALVASIDLACEIVFSRPPGYYIVYEIQVDPLRLRTQSAGGEAFDAPRRRAHGDSARARSGRTISSRDRVAIQTRSTTPLLPSDPESA
jgi:hypothetical protein